MCSYMKVSLPLSHLDAFLATEVSTKALQREAYLQSRRGISDFPSVLTFTPFWLLKSVLKH